MMKIIQHAVSEPNTMWQGGQNDTARMKKVYAHIDQLDAVIREAHVPVEIRGLFIYSRALQAKRFAQTKIEPQRKRVRF